MASALSVDFYAEISAMEVFFRDWGIDGSEDSFAVAAREELDKARQLLREERTEENLKNMLASWAKAIMDSTYCKECELIERDFEDQKTYTSILLSLDQILVVSGNLGGDGPVTWLGEEVAETVHWRCGALRYMNLVTNESLATKEQIDESIRHLDAVGRIRRYDASETNIQESNDQVAEMIAAGLWSDTHVLARAYMSELAFLGWRVIDKKSEGTFKSMAVDLCTGFINIVHRHLSDAGWSTEKQSQMLEELKQ